MSSTNLLVDHVYYIVLSLRSKENAFCQQTEGEDTAMLCTSFSVEDLLEETREIVQTDDKNHMLSTDL